MTPATEKASVGRTLVYLAWVLVMAFFFAKVEIQIEGGAGWAASLPTWRIEHSLWLDIFWGGRPMTGYHAWVFSFMALAFLSPLAFNGRWTLRDLGLALAGLSLFWVCEDGLWFLLNPAYGWERFNPAGIAWHKRWLWGLPVDYWSGLVVTAVLLALRHRRRGAPRDHELR